MDLSHRQDGRQLGVLEHDADSLAQRGARVARIEAEHVDLPAVAVAEALEDLHGRRLAGPVRTEQAEDLALAHLEVDAAHGLHAAVRLAQAAHCDSCHAADRTRQGALANMSRAA